MDKIIQINNKNFFMNHGKSVAKSKYASDSGKGDYSLTENIVRKHAESIVNKIDGLPNAEAIWKRLRR
jgi:hypothetical protein